MFRAIYPFTSSNSCRYFKFSLIDDISIHEKMAAGCIAFARISLLRHPSFWDETQAEQLIQQILEDPRLVNSEQGMYDNIAMQTVPFVAPLDEASVNVGFISTQSAASGAKKDVFRRLLANISAESVQGMFRKCSHFCW